MPYPVTVLTLNPPPIEVRIDIPPRPKGRPRFVRATGRAYTDAATRKYESAVREGFRGWAEEHNWVSSGSPLLVCMDFSFAPPQKPKWWAPASKGKSVQGAADLDNYIKAVSDAGNDILWDDDVQIVTLYTTKRFGDPGVLLRAWEQLSD